MVWIWQTVSSGMSAQTFLQSEKNLLFYISELRSLLIFATPLSHDTRVFFDFELMPLKLKSWKLTAGT